MAKKKPQPTRRTKRPLQPVPSRSLLGDLRQLIEAARERTARAVNSSLVTMYWQIGKRIREDVLQNQRASYGEEIVYALSRQLTAEYGRGFTRANLFHMMRFADVFPDEQIVNALRSQLSWTHFRELLSIDDRLKRDFYAELCRVERWSTRSGICCTNGPLWPVCRGDTRRKLRQSTAAVEDSLILSTGFKASQGAVSLPKFDCGNQQQKWCTNV
jgi:hypothetical protein